MRLVGRIWLHGVLLFAGIALTVLLARFAMPRQDTIQAIRAHPVLAHALAERVLARRDDPPALRRELAAMKGDAALIMTVYDRRDAVIDSLVDPPLPPATADERAAMATHEVRGGRRFVVGAWRDGALDAYVVAIAPSHLWTVHVLLVLGVAVLIALGFVAFPLARAIARPLAKLEQLTRALGAGDLTVRAEVVRRDEIGQLGEAFNAMAAQIQKLRAAERQLLGDVSHELRTPLARLRVVLELATAGSDLAKIERYHAELATDLSELEQLLDDIIGSTRLDAADRWAEAQPPLRLRRIEPAELIDASVARFGARWPERTLRVRVAPLGDARLDADPAILRRALDNLLDNARKYSDDAIELVVARAGDQLRLEVIDRGAGIAVEDQPRVFTAFFRADKSRTRATGGVGLGLVLARRVVEAHGGAIGFASAPGEPTTFWFCVPLKQAT